MILTYCLFYCLLASEMPRTRGECPSNANRVQLKEDRDLGVKEGNRGTKETRWKRRWSDRRGCTRSDGESARTEELSSVYGRLLLEQELAEFQSEQSGDIISGLRTFSHGDLANQERLQGQDRHLTRSFRGGEIGLAEEDRDLSQVHRLYQG